LEPGELGGGREFAAANGIDLVTLDDKIRHY
jgi:hypothetical protein